MKSGKALLALSSIRTGFKTKNSKGFQVLLRTNNIFKYPMQWFIWDYWENRYLGYKCKKVL